MTECHTSRSSGEQAVRALRPPSPLPATMAGARYKDAPQSAASQSAVWPARPAGGLEKRYKDQIKTALKKCKSRPGDLEGLAADRNTWRQMCQDGTKALEEDRTARRQERQE